MNVEQQLLTKGKVSRGKLGVTIQEVNQGLADSFGLDKPRGALVASVEPDSPAAKAGIQPGDVILKFNGGSRPLLGPAGHGRRRHAGQRIAHRDLAPRQGVGTQRQDGRVREHGERGRQGRGGAGRQARPGGEAAHRPGKRQGDIAHGLIVEDVADGPAARAGIRPSDVIVSVNGNRVDSVEQLRSQVERSGKNAAVLVSAAGSACSCRSGLADPPAALVQLLVGLHALAIDLVDQHRNAEAVQMLADQRLDFRPVQRAHPGGGRGSARLRMPSSCTCLASARRA